jgi:hypothetical protein
MMTVQRQQFIRKLLIIERFLFNNYNIDAHYIINIVLYIQYVVTL